ncbi:MAG TPA: hypothetical protein VGH65_04835, partial [Verrucomicrobiaceae bacterium]
RNPVSPRQSGPKDPTANHCSTIDINMKPIIALVLVFSALALGACANKQTSQPPPQSIDMGHRSYK